MALDARVEEVDLTSEDVSSVVKAWPMAMPLIMMEEEFSKPWAADVGALVEEALA